MAVEWPNTGILFKNDKKEKPKDRDYSGTLDTTCACCGEEATWWLSAWVKQGRRGKFLSISLTRKDEKSAATANPPAAAASVTATNDDDIPF